MSCFHYKDAKFEEIMKNERNIKHWVYTFLLIICFSGLNLNAQVSREILSDIENTDIKSLSENFNEPLELLLPDHEGNFTKQEAVSYLNAFLKQYPKSGMKWLHKGNSESTSFAIALYSSGENQFRIYVLIREQNKVQTIQQLRIEKTFGN